MSMFLRKRLTVSRLARGITMSKKSIIDSVKVGKPCSEEWEKMRGDDRIRFCSHCAKDVRNLSALTRKEAARMVQAFGPNICIRYVRDPITERPVFAGQLHQITRRSPAFTAGIVSASLALSAAAYGQAQPQANERGTVITVNQRVTGDEPETATPDTEADPTLGSLEGMILDTDGNPVLGVVLMIVGPDGYIDHARTDERGNYQFSELEAGTYVIRIASSTGKMKKAMRGIELAEGQTLFQNIYVKVAAPQKGGIGVGSARGWGMGGAIAMVEYDLELNRAVGADDIREVRRLLAAGKDVNGRDKNYDGITPLFLAVENGNVEMVKLLLDNGANASTLDDTKRTVLMSMDSDATPQLVEILLRAGADMNGRDEDGATVLLHTIESINVEVLDALIKSGADINRSDQDGETALMKAADDNDLEKVEALVLAGAKVNEKDKGGESAWDKASNPKIEQFLEVHGAVADYGTIEVIAATVGDNDEIDPDAESDEPGGSPKVVELPKTANW